MSKLDEIACKSLDELYKVRTVKFKNEMDLEWQGLSNISKFETIERILELHFCTHNATSFEESEETDSGVFGVHIVFERKKEV